MRLRYLRLSPFDPTSEYGRSEERHRRIVLTGALTIFGKIVSLLTPLVTIPLSLRYLGAEKYGLWMTISSVTVSLSFADLGIGLGLLNALAECNGRGDRDASRTYISSAFVLMSGLAILFGVLYLVFRKAVPWGRLLTNLSPSQVHDVPELFAILFVCFLAAMPLGIVDRIYLAYQEGYISSIFQTFGSILSLIGVIVAIRLRASISELVLVFSGSPLIILLASTVYLLAYRRPWMLPKLSLVRLRPITRLFRLGSMFFVLQFCYTLAYNSDNLVIGATLGLSAVAAYAVAAKLFAVVASLVPLVLNPIWPAYIEAASKGDVDWVKKTFTRALGVILAVSIPANLILLVSGSFIIRLWTHGQIQASTSLLVALALWGAVSALANTASVFMNAMNVVAYQSIGALLMSLLNLALSIFLAKRIGSPGVVWGSVISQSVMLVPSAFIVIPRVLSKLKANSESSSQDPLQQTPVASEKDEFAEDPGRGAVVVDTQT